MEINPWIFKRIVRFLDWRARRLARKADECCKLASALTGRKERTRVVFQAHQDHLIDSGLEGRVITYSDGTVHGVNPDGSRRNLTRKKRNASL